VYDVILTLRSRRPSSTPRHTIGKCGGRSSHAWGRLYCPHNDPDCECGFNCVSSIYGTPSKPEDYAKRLRKRVDKCTGAQRRPTESQE